MGRKRKEGFWDGWRSPWLPKPKDYRGGTRAEVTGRGPAPVQAEPKGDETWECAPDEVNGCPIVKAPAILVPFGMFRDWVELAARFDDEWFAYLVGEDTEKGLLVTEMYFPAQVATKAYVEAIAELTPPKPGTIGKVHSHNSMAAFHSSTDTEHQNWPVEIVVNAKAEVDAKLRVKLECGRFSRVSARLRLVGTGTVDTLAAQLEAALKAGKEWEAARPKRWEGFGGFDDGDEAHSPYCQCLHCYTPGTDQVKVEDKRPLHLQALADWKQGKLPQ